nr:hypothetical protein [Schaalia sp. ZJ405]
MLRILIPIVWFVVTVYAITDWYRTPDDEAPARIPKMMWLFIIILTIPSFSIGAIAWVVIRWISQAEKQQGRGPSGFPWGPKNHEPPSAPTAPDDDPEFLFRLERDIQRRRREEERQRNERASGSASSSPDHEGSPDDSPSSTDMPGNEDELPGDTPED